MILKHYLRVIGYRGVWNTILANLFKREQLFKIRPPDINRFVTLRVPSTDVSAYAQVFMNKEYDFIARFQPRVIIDAGANVGLASVFFAERFPNCKIIAIEPESRNFDILKINISGYPNIIALHAALWHRNEKISVMDSGYGNWGFVTNNGAYSSSGISENQIESVRGLTIDQIIEEFEVEMIDILKIDVESSEKEVFQDTSAWINKTRSIIIELHDRMKPGCSRSFYMGTPGFDSEWYSGENIYISRDSYLGKP